LRCNLCCKYGERPIVEGGLDPGKVVLPKRPVDLRHELPGVPCRPSSVRGIYPHVTGRERWSWKQILLLMLHRRRIRTTSTFLPSKSWWLTTRERSTTTTAMPQRLDTWIGLSSQIRSAVTTERRWLAFLSPTRGERFRTGSSTFRTSWCRPRFRSTPSHSSCAMRSR